MRDPAIEASIAIRQVMLNGSARDGCNETWRDKPPNNHASKAARHIVTYRMVRDGEEPANGEDHIAHLKNAITRLAMQLVKELDDMN